MHPDQKLIFVDVSYEVTFLMVVCDRTMFQTKYNSCDCKPWLANFKFYETAISKYDCHYSFLTARNERKRLGFTCNEPRAELGSAY